MDGAVASAGKDDLRAVADGISRLGGRRAGSGGGQEFDWMAKRGKRIDDLAELLCAALPFAARGGIVDEDAMHLIILGGTSPSTRRVAAGQSLDPAFLAGSAGRARAQAASPMRMRRLVLIQLFIRLLPLLRRQRTVIWKDVSFITVQTWCLSSTMSLRCQSQSIFVL